MRINKSMTALLEAKQVIPSAIAPVYHFPIWQKTDSTGRPYWGVGTFFSWDRCEDLQGRNLSQLEWDANELNYFTYSEERVGDLLRDTIGVLKAWQEMLEREYPHTEFCVFASYDDGSAMIEDEDDYPIMLSTTFRFWATRGNNDVVNLDHFDEWEQPAILIVCNQAH